MSSCIDIAELALNMRDEFRNTNWERRGFHSQLEIRIGLDLQLVTLDEDESGQTDGTSRGLDHAARIEPVAEPNEIFCSEIFWLGLSSEDPKNIIAECLGPITLAKNAGTEILYHLRWTREQPRRDVGTPKPRPSDANSGVRFWHTVNEREHADLDVKGLIRRAQQHIVITGTTLTYPAERCKELILSKLAQGVTTGIIIPDMNDLTSNYYRPYVAGDFATKLSYASSIYQELFDQLNDDQRQHFALCRTNVPLTHSIGLYDGDVYINEFCIKVPTSLSPSFCPERGSSSYAVAVSELKLLLDSCACDKGQGLDKLRTIMSSL